MVTKWDRSSIAHWFFHYHLTLTNYEKWEEEKEFDYFKNEQPLDDEDAIP